MYRPDGSRNETLKGENITSSEAVRCNRPISGSHSRRSATVPTPTAVSRDAWKTIWLTAIDNPAARSTPNRAVGAGQISERNVPNPRLESQTVPILANHWPGF